MMPAPRAPKTERGFTLIETMMGIVLGALLVATSTHVVSSTTGLAREDRTQSDARAEHRAAHRALERVLRNVELKSLTGFDVDNKATKPTFKRVTGMTSGTVTLTGVEELLWVARPKQVTGLGQVGDVVRKDAAGKSHVTAPAVLKDGFLVRRQGRNLVVRLSTFHGANADERIVITSEAVVSLRN